MDVEKKSWYTLRMSEDELMALKQAIINASLNVHIERKYEEVLDNFINNLDNANG